MNCTVYQMKGSLCFSCVHKETGTRGTHSFSLSHIHKQTHIYFYSTAVLHQGHDLQLFCIITTALATLESSTGRKSGQSFNQLLRYGAVCHQRNGVTASDAWQLSNISYSVKRRRSLMPLLTLWIFGVITLVRTRFQYYHSVLSKWHLCEGLNYLGKLHFYVNRMTKTSTTGPEELIPPYQNIPIRLSKNINAATVCLKCFGKLALAKTSDVRHVWKINK